MRRRVIAVMIAAALALTACSEASPDASTSSASSADISQITIGNSDALAPELTIPAEANFTTSQGKVEWQGEGAPLVDGQPLLLDMYGVSLEDGSEVVNTFDGLPRSYVLAREVLGDELYELLINANVGTRVLVVAPAAESSATQPNVVMVVDVLSDRAVGTEIPQREDLPWVTVDKDTGEPDIAISDNLVEPTDLQSETTIQGDGPQVKKGSYVLVNYKAVHWDDGSLFSSSWPVETAPFSTQIGTGQVIKAWDQALLDQTVGSQVNIVAPPEFGYPDEGTLVFVVDILDIWTPVE